MSKKEIKVLYIITKLELGGAQKVCLSLLKGLRQAGNKALLISGKQGPLAKTLQNDKEIYLFEHFKREISFLGFLKECTTFFHLIGYIKKLKKEYPRLIVHTHSTKAGLLGRWAALFARVKTRIHTVHGFGFHPYQNKLGWLINYCLEFITSFITTHYVCVSSYDVKVGVRLLPNFSQKHSIIRASVNHQTFQPAQKITLAEKKFIFGTISCFKKQKNLFDLLQAFNNCYQKNPQVKLEIIGDGEQREKIEHWIADHHLESNIILLGWQNNVLHFMQQWDAFILSSLWEGLPCAVVEARLLQLPVLSYDTGGIHDIIYHGENGFLYSPKNWLDLAQGMNILTSNINLCKKFKNYQDNLTDFDLKLMINKHIDLYRLN